MRAKRRSGLRNTTDEGAIDPVPGRTGCYGAHLVEKPQVQRLYGTAVPFVVVDSFVCCCVTVIDFPGESVVQ
jgi:hypothetical protein